jgi:hypothetical protein
MIKIMETSSYDKLLPDDELILNEFKEKISDRVSIVDPLCERDWFDVAYGFFLGKYIEPSRAYELAVELHKRNMI